MTVDEAAPIDLDARVHPELAEALAAMPAVRFEPGKLGVIREFLDREAAPAPSTVAIADHRVTSRDGHELAVRTYRPVDAPPGPLPGVFHVYGGGLIYGSLVRNDAENAALATDLGAVVASAEYRVAPEHPYPAAIDDCDAGYRFVLANAAELDIDPSRIALTGASAGGGLAAALAIRLRDGGAEPPRLLLLRYPMLDDRNVTPSSHWIVDDRVWNRTRNQFGWNSYLSGIAGDGDVSADAAPARADDLTGLPATVVTVGALDLFLDESLAFARRLVRDGVDVEIHVYPGLFHGAPRAAPDSDVIRRWLDDERRALRRALLSS